MSDNLDTQEFESPPLSETPIEVIPEMQSLDDNLGVTPDELGSINTRLALRLAALVLGIGGVILYLAKKDMPVHSPEENTLNTSLLILIAAAGIVAFAMSFSQNNNDNNK